MTFDNLDWLVVAAYFVVIFGVAFWAGLSERTKDTDGYFLAGRNVGWFVIGASVFASNIGSEHLVGLAGAGASSGVAVAQFEILAGLILLLLGWLFVPFYLKSGVFTMPEFLEKRYNSGARFYLALISVVGYVLTKISVTIAAGGIVFEALMGIDFWVGASIVVVATGAYTLWGGLRAVLYTDLVQMFVLIGGAIVITVIGLDRLGGWQSLTESVEPGFLSVWKPMNHPDFPWTGVLFGAPILAVWYWCTDQFIVQRVLSANGISNARRGTIFAAYLKQLPLFIFVLPGIVAYALVQQGALELGKPDEALPALVGELLPAGLRGLVAAGLLAALMSSLSSVFNSCATILTVDIYQKLNPQASERALVNFGRIGVLLMVAFGLLWIPNMGFVAGGLFKYIQSVQAYIAPPIAAVFLIGVLWPRANAVGAIATLLVGFVLGIGRLVLEIYQEDINGLALAVTQINFLHFAFLLFVISVIILILVSLATGRPDSSKTDGLTLGNGDGERTKGRAIDLVLSVGVVLLIGALWWIFSPLVLAQ